MPVECNVHRYIAVFLLGYAATNCDSDAVTGFVQLW